MQLFYLENIKSDYLEGSEYNHCCNVLRKNQGDKISVTDGNGNLYSTEIEKIKNKKVYLHNWVKTLSKKKQNNTCVAVAPPKSYNRLEWMVEKLTEIGISKIIFIITSNSERKKIRKERLEKKIISAMKQCNSLFKTKIDEIYNLDLFLKKFKFKNKFIADIESSSINIKEKNKGDSIIAIGPEGDFTSVEKSLLFEEGYKKISLGNMILRTETAAVVGGFLLKNKGL